MSPEIQAALPFIVIGLVLVLLVIWLVARSGRKTTVVDDESTGPTLDRPAGDDRSGDPPRDGAKPTRNQALIDSPKSAEIIQGTTSANANADEVAMAGENADAEAGVSVAPTVGDPVPPRAGEQPEPLEESAPDAAETAPHPEAREGERTRPSPPATPAKKPEPAPASPSAAPSSEGDDLTRIKGLGPKLAAMLNEQGITRFDQIANWSDEDAARIDAKLGRFKGRITRDQWIEQARLLQSGDQAAFDARFGRT